MKKLLSIFTVITIVLSLFTTTIMATDPVTNEPAAGAPGQMKVIYLNSSHPDGKDSNSGTSTADPVVSIVRAFELLGDEGGIVCISGDTIIDHPEYTYDARTVAGWQIDCYPHTGKIYVTSINGAKLIKDNEFEGTTFSLGGPVEFYNVTVQNKFEQNLNFYAYGHELVMGNGIVYEGNGSDTKGWNIYGFTANSEGYAGADINPDISIYSGTYISVSGAGTKSAGAVRGNSTVNVYGGEIATLKAGGPGGLEGNQVLNLYNDVLPGKITDQLVTGSVTCNLYSYSAGVLPTFKDDNSYVINNEIGVANMPDSDLIIFEVNDTPPAGWTPGTDPVPTETNPIEETKPVEPEQTDPKSEETDPITPEETDPVQTPGTEAPGTEKPAEGGCGGTVSSALALVAITSLGAFALTKKKKQ